MHHCGANMASKSVVRAQLPIRVKGRSFCPNHLGAELTLCCHTCSELACEKCITSVHNNHVLDSLSDVTPDKIRNIQAFIQRTEQQDIIRLKDEVLSIHRKKEDNKRNSQLHEQELRAQGNRLKEEVDIVIGKSIAISKEIEQENDKRLDVYGKSTATRIGELTTLIQTCKDTVDQGCGVDIYDMEKDVDTLPAIDLSLCSLNFTPNNHPAGYLELARGKLTTFGHQLVHSVQCDDKNSDDEKQENKNQDDGIKQVVSPVQLEEVYTRKIPYTQVSAISATIDQNAWICSKEFDRLFYVTDEPKCSGFQEGHLKVCATDVSISPITQNVWVSSVEGNAIMEILVTPEDVVRPIVRFTVESAPLCFCVARHRAILVGITGKLMRVDTNGDVLLTKAVNTPSKISTCSATSQIAVVDLDSCDDGGNGSRPHVLVLDMQFHEMYRYHGEGTTDRTPSPPFYPTDVSFNSTGKLLLVGDYNNNSILILNSRKGDFVRTIYRDAWHIMALSVTSEDSVWIVVKYKDYPNYKAKLLKPVC